MVFHLSLIHILIADWRDKWQKPQMPFYFVQLPNQEKKEEAQDDADWAAMRLSLIHISTGKVATLFEVTCCKNSNALGPFTQNSPIWDTSKTPTALHTCLLYTSIKILKLWKIIKRNV